MASRTTRRNTFSVSADNDDFNISYYNQAEFKGINTNKMIYLQMLLHSLMQIMCM